MEEVSKLKNLLKEAEVTQRELRLRVDDLEDFIENAAVPLHWVNGSGIVIWVNKAELDLLGYTKEEYIGKHISNFHADKHIIEDILDRLVKKQTLRNYFAKLKCKNGEIKLVLLNSNVRWDGDKFLHTRCFTREISDLKIAEQKQIDLINDLQDKYLALKAENEALKKQVRPKSENA